MATLSMWPSYVDKPAKVCRLVENHFNPVAENND